MKYKYTVDGRGDIEKDGDQAHEDHGKMVMASEKDDHGDMEKSKNLVDHTPHELFIEMDVLQGDEWVEKSRYAKKIFGFTVRPNYV